MLLFFATPGVAQQLESVAAVPSLIRSPSPDLLPKPLSASDADRYKIIFRLQEKGAFPAADHWIGQIENRMLLPYVEAHRFLSAKYKSSKTELTKWLAFNGDLPEAYDLHKLAKAKGVTVSFPAKKAPARALPPNVLDQDHDSDWLSGLSLWQNKRYLQAAQAFERAANKKKITSEHRAAAAYWTGRAYRAAGQPARVSKWFLKAAETPRSFYGQLARRALGIGSGLNWTIPAVGFADIRDLMEDKVGRAALALIQIGQVSMAERQLNSMVERDGEKWNEALLGVSQAAGLPSLALRIGNELRKEKNTDMDAALFPIPAWRPGPGYQVNRALIYSIMRQESGFNPNAVSPMGAKGLMQLMPATARHVSGKRKIDLHDPIVSIGIAQDYIRELLSDDLISNDLILLAAAYNAGPGNLKKWYAASKAKNDALLFMETVPSRETRHFIERVLAGYWIYRDRLALNTPSLDELVGGGWAPYREDSFIENETLSAASVQ